MNIETGALYYGEDIAKAQQRGETVVAVSEHVAKLMVLGHQVFKDAPGDDSPTLAELADRVATLEGKQKTTERMKALGLVCPIGGV
jgi:hypothetical protein